MEFMCTTVCAFPLHHSSSFNATPFLSINLRAHSLLSVIFFWVKVTGIIFVWSGTDNLCVVLNKYPCSIVLHV